MDFNSPPAGFSDFNSPPSGFNSPPTAARTVSQSISDELERPSVVVVTVDEAQMDGFGPTRHTSYRISCQLQAGGEPSACRHRFSEFVKLRTELVNSGPGVVIPPLPDKQVMNRFSKEFIEKRRNQLQIFLQRVVDHPLASSNSALFGFLSWPEMFRATVVGRAKEVQMPPCPPDDMGDALKVSVPPATSPRVGAAPTARACAQRAPAPSHCPPPVCSPCSLPP